MRTILLSALMAGGLAAAAAAEPAATGPAPLDDNGLAQVAGGQDGFSPLTFALFKNVAIQDLLNSQTNAQLRSQTNNEGNLADGEAGATASGLNTFTDAVSLTNVTQGQSSASFARSISGAGLPLTETPPDNGGL